MSDKSHVTMEQHQCFVCLKIFDTGSLLLHKHLSPVFERNTLTGHSVCAECQKLMDDGFVALIGIHRDPIRDEPPVEVPRSQLAWLKAEAWPKIFNVPVPDKKACFLHQDALQSIINEVKPDAQEETEPITSSEE